MEKLSINPERFAVVRDNYSLICDRIKEAADRAGTALPELVAVTKTVPVEVINYSVSLGVSHIGENRVQELASKYDALDKDGLRISVIGHLQTNKVKSALSMSRMIQSLDSKHLADEISLRACQMGAECECLVEINAGDEETKSGVSFEEAEELALYAASLKGIKVCGLMAIPPVEPDVKKNRAVFEKIHKLFIDIGDKNHDNSNVRMKYLSMGMSSDYFEAILEGSNMVRIGSALYGARQYK